MNYKGIINQLLKFDEEIGPCDKIGCPNLCKNEEDCIIYRAVNAIKKLLEQAEKAEEERDDYKELFFSYKHVCGGLPPEVIEELVTEYKDYNNQKDEVSYETLN